jgi:hypothetical protein
MQKAEVGHWEYLGKTVAFLAISKERALVINS